MPCGPNSCDAAARTRLRHPAVGTWFIRGHRWEIIPLFTVFHSNFIVTLTGCQLLFFLICRNHPQHGVMNFQQQYSDTVLDLWWHGAFLCGPFYAPDSHLRRAIGWRFVATGRPRVTIDLEQSARDCGLPCARGARLSGCLARFTLKIFLFNGSLLFRDVKSSELVVILLL